MVQLNLYLYLVIERNGDCSNEVQVFKVTRVNTAEAGLGFLAPTLPRCIT